VWTRDFRRRRAGDDGRELLHELDRLEEQMRGAIVPHRLELDQDAPVAAEADAVLGEGGRRRYAITSSGWMDLKLLTSSLAVSTSLSVNKAEAL
jgi:hypothetical protein